MHSFERILSVCVDDIEFALRGFNSVAWADFCLNPRRLRGSDFLMRWSQGVWSEERLIQAVNETPMFFASPYGPSSTAPEDDVRAFELYFERLEAAGLGDMKRPDLLVCQKSDYHDVWESVQRLGGIAELPFITEDHPDMLAILSRALIAVECENSLWKARLMPDYGAPLRPQKRLDGKPGLRKSAVLPTVIIKEEDRERLLIWQKERQVPIQIWHVFYDVAYGLALTEAERLIEEGYILPTEQTFQAPGGATTRKSIYKFYHHYAYELGEALTEPELIARHITDKNGHILPYVHFQGGKMQLCAQALALLQRVADEQN